MNALTHLVMKIYRLLVACYPVEFRADFEDEMQDVFAAALREAQHPEGEQPWRLFWREFRDLPGAVLQEHLQERIRKMVSNELNARKSPTASEMLAAMIIFLFPLFSIILTTANPPQWVNIILLVLFWGGIIFAVGLAVLRGVPRWSLSYLGVVLMLIITLSPNNLSGWIYTYFIESFGQRTSWSLPVRMIYGGIFSFIMSLLYLLGALILVNLMRLLPHTRGVWQRIRTDWTQLSFILYGGLVFYIIFTFEAYRHEDIWKFAAWLCLVFGAWFYLRAKGGKQRILALIFGATGAMWIVTLAKWVLIPLEGWVSRYALIAMEDVRWVSTSNEVIAWLSILAMLIAPVLLNALPPAPRSKEEGTATA